MKLEAWSRLTLNCVLLCPLIFPSKTIVNVGLISASHLTNSEVVTLRCLLFQQWPSCHIWQCRGWAAGNFLHGATAPKPNFCSRWLASISPQTHTSCKPAPARILPNCQPKCQCVKICVCVGVLCCLYCVFCTFISGEIPVISGAASGGGSPASAWQSRSEERTHANASRHSVFTHYSCLTHTQT